MVFSTVFTPMRVGWFLNAGQLTWASAQFVLAVRAKKRTVAKRDWKLRFMDPPIRPRLGLPPEGTLNNGGDCLGIVKNAEGRRLAAFPRCEFDRERCAFVRRHGRVSRRAPKPLAQRYDTASAPVLSGRRNAT